MLSMVTVLGLLGVAGGAMNYFIFPTGLEMGLNSFINLKESGMVYPAYIDPPFPSNSSYYIYEITNPREVLKGEKMEFKLRGPYKFKTYMKRSNIEFRRGNEVLRFDTSRKAVLDEENSAKDMDEKMWLLNPILLGLQGSVRSIVLDKIPFQRISEPIVFNSINVILDQFKERLMSRKTPRDLLIGYKIELLDFVMGMADRLGLGSLLPPGPPNNIFGVAYVQNETVDTMEVWTGIKDSKRFGDVQSWNNKEKLTVWSGACNQMEGTNGELYKPLQLEPKPIRVFLAQLCRAFFMEPVTGELEEAAYGIKTYQYQLSPRLFQGVRTYPRNKCFCKNPRTYDCQYDGLLSMGPCFFDAPLYFAKGNFKDMDQKIKDMVVDETVFSEKLSDKQSFWIEPITGTIIKVDLTLVATFKVVRQPYMRDLANVRNITYAPLFVASESVVLPYELVRPVKYLQIVYDNYKPASMIMAAGGSGLLIMKFASSFFF